MLTKRIIPSLDVKDGKVVKGKNFNKLEYAGNPVELAAKYEGQGADELVFLDITASIENRKTMTELVKEVAKEIFIPFTVGGGISMVSDIAKLLNSGADKVSLNSAAVNNPKLITQAAQRFGSQCIMIGIDAKKSEGKWKVFTQGGMINTGIDAVEWAKKAELLGAGEILLTSIDRDGTKNGYEIELTKSISESVGIPVIASGGAKDPESILKVLNEGKADAALAASIFHYNKYSIAEVKKYLKENAMAVRL